MTTTKKKLELPKGKLGPNFVRKILPWVETYWHQYKRYPSDTELAAEFGFNADDLLRLHVSKYYLNCLRERGISHEPGFFTPEQVAAISLISNVYDTRPPAAKLAAIGVSAEQYNGWMQDPKFKEELQRRSEDILGNIFPEAQAALAKQVMNGSIPALKFYYEITGRAQSPETVNIKMLMVKVIEAIQKHVKDPAVLAAIASEIQIAQSASVAPAPASLPQSVSPLRNQFKKHLEEVNGNDNS
jgi:hypothetical protein